MVNELYSVPRSVIADYQTNTTGSTGELGLAQTRPEETKEDQTKVAQQSGEGQEQDVGKNMVYDKVRSNPAQVSGGRPEPATEPPTADTPLVTRRKLITEVSRRFPNCG